MTRAEAPARATRLRPRRLPRHWSLPVADLAIVAAATYLAFALRFEDPLPIERIRDAMPLALLPIVIRPVVGIWAGIYQPAWRHASVPELTRVAAAVLVGSVAMLAAYAGASIVDAGLVAGFARSTLVLEPLLTVVGLAAVRLLPRFLADRPSSGRAEGRSVRGAPTILYGSGEAGARTARAATRQPGAGVDPVAFLDDDPRRWGEQVAGVPVIGGLDSLEWVAQRTGARQILVTMPSAPGEQVRRIAETALAAGLTVHTIPSVEELLRGHPATGMGRPIRLEDLLRRTTVPAQAADDLRAAYQDQSIMVSGAAGSIGSELARQLVRLAPRSLVLVDRAEGPTFELQQEIDETRPRPDAVDFHLADVTDRDGMLGLLRQTRPTMIFHAAAYKHVPLMEQHPLAAIEVNVIGTRRLLDAAEESGVHGIVLVSTDKAVEPASVMGATKRIAELMVAERGRRLGRPWVAVRFGNVLGSSGSVVPLWERQLAMGRPLTITDPEMTRYFMTVSEAVHLIVLAGVMSRPGDLFILDMGEPVRIGDLVRDVIRFSGHDVRDVTLDVIGRRPGEKLHERLHSHDETLDPTDHPRILRARSTGDPPGIADGIVDSLERCVADGDEEAARRFLMDAATPSSSPPGRTATPAT